MERPTDKIEEQDWIERYLQGEMSAEEHLFFENELKKDINLTTTMEHLKGVHQLMQQAFLQEQALITIRKLQAKKRFERKTFTIVRYFAMASAACFVFATYLTMSSANFTDSENDFTVVRSANSSTMPPSQRMIFDQFFEGQAHIAEGQYVMAVRNFETVLQSTDLRPYFREAAQWHLIVAYLKSGDLSRAENLYESFNNCVDCEYQVSSLNRWKIWWQIHMQKLVH